MPQSRDRGWATVTWVCLFFEQKIETRGTGILERALAVLAEDPSSVLSPTPTWWLTTSVTLVPRDPPSYSSLCSTGNTRSVLYNK